MRNDFKIVNGPADQSGNKTFRFETDLTSGLSSEFLTNPSGKKFKMTNVVFPDGSVAGAKVPESVISKGLNQDSPVTVSATKDTERGVYWLTVLGNALGGVVTLDTFDLEAMAEGEAIVSSSNTPQAEAVAEV